MSIILLLMLFVTWMAWAPQPGAAPQTFALPTVFLCGYVILILTVGLICRRLARRVIGQHIVDGRRRFSWIISVAQCLVPIWFGIGVFYMGWGACVQRLLGSVANWDVQTPSLWLGILPPCLAWMGLWWAQFPMDTALREQNLLVRLESGLPVYAPPSFRTYFLNKLRMQLLFTAIPILLIVASRDLIGFIFRSFGISDASQAMDLGITVGVLALVLTVSPEILRRILSTQAFPDGELGRRLQAVVDRAGVSYRGVLLWNTNHSIGNAMVMGPIPWFRYVLLSDLLIEALADDQIEAVFAHEIGHVIHRHILWYAGLMLSMSLTFFGLGVLLDEAGQKFGMHMDWIDTALPFVALGAFVVWFGYVSRRFERQADVFAARTLEAMQNGTETFSPVGPAGAEIFNSALLRVSDLANVPLETTGRFAGSLRRRLSFLSEWLGNVGVFWLHGSIASRMRYITHISQDPQRTVQFDRRMRHMRVGLLSLLVASIVLATWSARQEPAGPTSSPLQQAPAAASVASRTIDAPLRLAAE